jgi:hypothetical protein
MTPFKKEQAYRSNPMIGLPVEAKLTFKWGAGTIGERVTKSQVVDDPIRRWCREVNRFGIIV